MPNKPFRNIGIVTFHHNGIYVSACSRRVFSRIYPCCIAVDIDSTTDFDSSCKEKVNVVYLSDIHANEVHDVGLGQPRRAP